MWKNYSHFSPWFLVASELKVEVKKCQDHPTAPHNSKETILHEGAIKEHKTRTDSEVNREKP